MESVLSVRDLVASVTGNVVPMVAMIVKEGPPFQFDAPSVFGSVVEALSRVLGKVADGDDKLG